jgi:hypothetical protein
MTTFVKNVLEALIGARRLGEKCDKKSLPYPEDLALYCYYPKTHLFSSIHTKTRSSPMTDRKKAKDPKITAFPFVRTKEMVASSGLSADTLKQLRREVLAEKIYWFHPPGSVRVLWNIRLVRSWLVMGGDSLDHKKEIETFYKSLASSDAA